MTNINKFKLTVEPVKWLIVKIYYFLLQQLMIDDKLRELIKDSDKQEINNIEGIP